MYKHLCTHYRLYSFTANLLIAVSMAGLACLGILTDVITVAYLITWGVAFAVMFGVGKFLNEEIEDIDNVKEHAEHDHT